MRLLTAITLVTQLLLIQSASAQNEILPPGKLPAHIEAIHRDFQESFLEQDKYVARYSSEIYSLGDASGWVFNSFADEIKLTKEQVKSVNELLEKRLKLRTSSLSHLRKNLEKTISKDLQKKHQEKAESDFFQSENNAEEALTDGIEELLPPDRLKSLSRLLIRKGPLDSGNLLVVVRHLDLSKEQIENFRKARRLIMLPNLPATSETRKEEGTAALSAENSLSREQLEEFNKALGRIPLDSTIEDYYKGLSKPQQVFLSKNFKVFANIEASLLQRQED